MYIRFSTLLPVAALAAVAAAAPSALEARQTTTQCNTGSIQCCSSTFSQSDYTYINLLSQLGIVLPSTQALYGTSCSPVSGTGSTCTQQPVCCTGNTFNGLINVGCSPMNING